MRTRGALPAAEALRIARDVALGVSVAHAEQIVHRDLKPDNLFLLPPLPGSLEERVKILDFGIAKLGAQGRASWPPGVTRAGALLGTPLYMSPEQCRGAGEVDARADIYSLGCILFAMLAGRPPFVVGLDGRVAGGPPGGIAAAAASLGVEVPDAVECAGAGHAGQVARRAAAVDGAGGRGPGSPAARRRQRAVPARPHPGARHRTRRSARGAGARTTAGAAVRRGDRGRRDAGRPHPQRARPDTVGPPSRWPRLALVVVGGDGGGGRRRGDAGAADRAAHAVRGASSAPPAVERAVVPPAARPPSRRRSRRRRAPSRPPGGAARRRPAEAPRAGGARGGDRRAQVPRARRRRPGRHGRRPRSPPPTARRGPAALPPPKPPAPPPRAGRARRRPRTAAPSTGARSFRSKRTIPYR